MKRSKLRTIRLNKRILQNTNTQLYGKYAKKDPLCNHLTYMYLEKGLFVVHCIIPVFPD